MRGRNRLGDRAVPRKGIGLTFPNRDADRPLAVSGNASELGDVCGSPGKSSLFFLTDWHPGIRLAGDRVECPVKHHTCGGVRCALDGP